MRKYIASALAVIVFCLAVALQMVGYGTGTGVTSVQSLEASGVLHPYDTDAYAYTNTVAASVAAFEMAMLSTDDQVAAPGALIAASNYEMVDPRCTGPNQTYWRSRLLRREALEPKLIRGYEVLKTPLLL